MAQELTKLLFAAETEEWKMREFVADHLYRKTESYFTQSAPVHFLQTPLDFRSMWGQSDYQVRSSFRKLLFTLLSINFRFFSSLHSF